MRKNELFELAFENLPDGGEIRAEFSWGSEAKTVPGFYAGGGVYKVRFLPKAENTAGRSAALFPLRARKSARTPTCPAW